MPHLRCLLVALAATFVVPSLAIAEPLALSDDVTCSSSRIADSGAATMLAQYITREEQQRRAQENLRQHRERENPPPRVEQSTGTTTGETYGREYLERQLQGDKPRTRTW